MPFVDASVGELADLEVLLSAPSRLGWRRLCGALDALPEGPLDPSLLSRLEEGLSRWPDRYRLLPGRWLHRLLSGETPPGLSLVSCLDVTLFSSPRRVPHAWARSPGLCNLTILRLYDELLGDEGAEALARSPHLTRLRELMLSTGITGAGAEALAASQNLAGLRSLSLNRNQVDARGLAALLSSPHLANLEALHLGRNPLSDASVRALCQSRLRLSRLDLDCAGLTGPQVRWLCESGCLSGLRELNLSNNRLDREACRALAACGQLAQLEALFLHGCGLGDEDADALLSSPHLRALRNLALSANALGPRSVEALAESALLSGLDELDVCHNLFAPGDAERRLRASPHLAGVRRLCI